MFYREMFKRLLLFVALVFIVSCISVSNIEIQVLEPAEAPVDPEARDIIVLNRTILEKPVSPLETTIPDTVLQPVFLTDLLNLTSTEAVFSFADILNESPGFNYIGASRIIETIRTDPEKVPEPLDRHHVTVLCDSLDADILTSLEVFVVEYRDSLIPEIYTEFGRNIQYTRGVIDIKITALWLTYDGEGGGLADEYVLRDSLRWEVADWDVDDVVAQMPDVEEVFLEAGYFAALTYARRIAPYWLTGERVVFMRGNRGMRKAYRHLRNFETDVAEAIYLDQLERWNNNLVAAAMHNLALVNELNGNFRQALVWARRSYQLSQNKLTAEYIDTLEERVRKSEVLDRQLGIN